MTEWFKVVACKVTVERHRGFKSHRYHLFYVKKKDLSLYKNLINIKGLGHKRILKLCFLIGTQKNTLIKNISGLKIDRLEKILNFLHKETNQDSIGKNLDFFLNKNIQRHKKINSHKGRRHRMGYPTRGQRTR